MSLRLRPARAWPAVLLLLAGCASAPAHNLRRESLARVPQETLQRAEAAAAALEPCLVRIRTGVGVKSGVVVRPDGLVLTCEHGSSLPGAREEIRFVDGRTGQAEVLGESPDGDLCVLRIVEPAGPFAAAPLAREARPGDWAFLASPSARGPWVSLAAGRIFLADMAGTFGVENRYRNPVLVIDAPAIRGESGSPILDAEGRIIGIASMAANTDRTSLLVAGSIREIRRVLPALEQGRMVPAERNPEAQIDAFFRSLLGNARGFWEGPGEPDAVFEERFRRSVERVERRLRERWQGVVAFTSDMTAEGLGEVLAEMEDTP